MLWIKAFHLISVICWFAGIFYLPRLFVYHADAKDEISNTRFKTMERRLYYGIMVPSAVATVGFGVWLMTFNLSYYRAAAWLHVKLALVFLVLVYHLYCGHCVKRFKRDANTHSSTYYRIMNEVPTLLLVAIVILAVVKPF